MEGLKVAHVRRPLHGVCNENNTYKLGCLGFREVSLERVQQTTDQPRNT